MPPVKVPLNAPINVIPLDVARSRLRQRLAAPPRIEPPAALTRPLPRHDIAAPDGAEGEEDDRLRMRQNLAAFLVLVAIVAGGTWLMASLHYYSRIQACFEAGHRNCLPLPVNYQAQHRR